MAYNDLRMDNQWLPFTPNRAFKKDPRVFVAADRQAKYELFPQELPGKPGDKGPMD